MTLYYWSRDYNEIYETTSHNANTSTLKNNWRYVSEIDIPYDDPKSMHFNVIFANGGKIIEVIRYKKSTNSNHDTEQIHTLHVIPEDDDLTESLGKIITLESLR